MSVFVLTQVLTILGDTRLSPAAAVSMLAQSDELRVEAGDREVRLFANREPVLAAAIVECKSLLGGDTAEGPVTIVRDPASGGEPVMHAQFNAPWSRHSAVRALLHARDIVINSTRHECGVIQLITTAPMRQLLGLAREIAEATDCMGEMTVTFSHYRYDTPPDGGSAA